MTSNGQRRRHSRITAPSKALPFSVVRMASRRSVTSVKKIVPPGMNTRRHRVMVVARQFFSDAGLWPSQSVIVQPYPNERVRTADPTRLWRISARDPFQSKLKLHPLSGTLTGIHAVSVTYSYRLTLMLKVTKKEIVLLDLGTHDEVYG